MMEAVLLLATIAQSVPARPGARGCRQAPADDDAPARRRDQDGAGPAVLIAIAPSWPAPHPPEDQPIELLDPRRSGDEMLVDVGRVEIQDQRVGHAGRISGGR